MRLARLLALAGLALGPSVATEVVAAPNNVDLPPAKPRVEKLVRIVGNYEYKGPIYADRVEIAADSSLVCAPGQPLRIIARRIIWEGGATINCDGAPGAAGQAGRSYGGWCVADDHGGARDEYLSGGNEVGGNGSKGSDGTDASGVYIAAGFHTFLKEKATIAISARGGAGGKGGAGGIGASKGFAPSGDDCAHGTNFISTQKAPNGLPGADGENGENASIQLLGRVEKGQPTVILNGAQKVEPSKGNFSVSEKPKSQRKDSVKPTLGSEPASAKPAGPLVKKKGLKT